MSLSRSLKTGASSLNAHQRRLDVISNNIANVNTVGYKSSRTNFTDQLSQTYRFGKSPDNNDSGNSGGINPSQIGLGVRLASITMNMAQGDIETTNRPLDLALYGEGFFTYMMNGQQLFSRAGAISRDSDGSFVDSNTGAYLQGYNVQTDANGSIIRDATGNNLLSNTIGNLRISNSIVSPPQQTQNISVSGNLNSSDATDAEREMSITVYDNQGATHNLTLTFTKSATANEYTVGAEIDGNAVNIGGAATSTVTFNADGTLNSPASLAITASDLNTAIGAGFTGFDATTPKDLTISLSDPSNVNGSLTQYSGINSASISSQDGYQSGTLEDLNVDKNGNIIGSFSNGQSEILGQVVVAKFTNPGGLEKTGDSFYSASINSGLPVLGTAGDKFPSTQIVSNALESSNVEMTEQFADLITTQRGFEAAARTVTVSDQLLMETNQLKR